MEPGRRSSDHYPSTMKRLAFLSCLPVLLTGCMHVKTAPIEVKPIHITVDVNVRIERALDNFFGDLDQKSATISTAGESTKP